MSIFFFSWVVSNLVAYLIKYPSLFLFVMFEIKSDDPRKLLGHVFDFDHELEQIMKANIMLNQFSFLVL